MSGQLGQLSWPSQLTKDWLSSIRMHWGTLCFIPGNGAPVCWIEEVIWLFIYMALHWTLPNRLINITLHIHIRVHLWLAIWCIMTCIMIVSHTNRIDDFSQSPCTVPSCRLVDWWNRFIYRANIARAPKLATLTGWPWNYSVSRGALVSRYFLTLIVLHPPGWDCVAVCIP